jgi:type VI secretion system protein ImpJ
MNYLSRVVWYEGMYLGPHHFQVQGRYFEDSIRFATSSLWYQSYGLVGGQFDPEALRNGIVSLLHARGIFPDGLTFHMPESDPLPEPRNIADLFPVKRDKVTIALAVPPRRPEGLNCITPESDGNAQSGDSVRFSAEAKMLYDETTGRDEKPVQVGRKNIRILLDTEPGVDALITLPVARVMRDGTGHFVFDPEFVPPCLEISAAKRLMDMLGRLLDILGEKSAMFSRTKQGDHRTWAEFSTREIANFWLLHTVNSALAPLRHQYMTKHGHPEELFKEMLRLGGALCPFALDSHPKELPLYDHDRLDECFGALDEHIRRHLETIVPSQYIAIPLKKVADYFYAGEVTDQRCLGRSRWIFGIHTRLGEAEIITSAPRVVKLCSQEFVPRLVQRALPGMTMTHLPVAPSAIPAKVDFQYFSVSKAGPCWDHIVQTRLIGVYVPGELPDPLLELLVILEA